jgi:MFS family permease
MSKVTNTEESLLVGGRINRGWLTVFAGTIGLAFGPSTLTILSFGVFVRPLQQEFGWTLGQTALAATIISYMIMIAAPVQGVLADRFGFWILIPLCAVGVWPLSYLRSTATWFDRRLGLSLGITNSGIGIGSVVIPPLAGFLVANYGWRDTYVVLAALALVITWPLAIALLRDNETARPANAATRVVMGSTFVEAARTRTFAIVGLVFLVMGALSSGLVVLQVPMLIEAGISPKVSAGLASVVGVSMIIGRIGTGYLLDYFHASRVLMWFILASSFAAIAFAVGITISTAPFAAALIGLIIGAEFDALSYIVPRYYGYRCFGKIYGTIYAIFQLGAGLGIAAIGFSRDFVGSFRPSMWVLAALTVMAGLLFSRVGPYRFAPGHIRRLVEDGAGALPPVDSAAPSR